jgi:predicted GTPase
LSVDDDAVAGVSEQDTKIAGMNQMRKAVVIIMNNGIWSKRTNTMAEMEKEIRRNSISLIMLRSFLSAIDGNGQTKSCRPF